MYLVTRKFPMFKQYAPIELIASRGRNPAHKGPYQVRVRGWVLN